MYLVYGKPSCPNCLKAKSLLEKIDATYQYIDVTVVNEAYDYLLNQGHRSVPQVYISGDKGGASVYVGGYAELEARIKSTT